MSKYSETIRAIGIGGLMKTLVSAVRHTNYSPRIILSKNSIVDISKQSDVHMSSQLIFGCIGRESHPGIGNSKLYVGPDASLRVDAGDNYAVIGPNSILHIEGDFEIGDSYINHSANIVCEDRIVIGDGCAISWNVDILDSDRHTIKVDGDKIQRSEEIRVEDDVLIGNHSGIKKGVTIGEGAVVASHSVVTRDVPPQSLVAGAPAEVIARNLDWE